MRSSSLYVMIALSGMEFGAEIVASHVTQSLVLLISAYHMLYNILSLLLLVISYRMSKGKTLKNTFGWARVKVLGLLINMLFLVALCFAACVEAVQTMVHASHEDTEPRHPILLIILGICNLVLNLICFILIGGYTHHQGCTMISQTTEVASDCDVTELGDGAYSGNQSSQPSKSTGTRSVWCSDHQVLDVSRDISSALSVIGCGCVILFLDGLILKYADALLAIASITVLLFTTYEFVKESGLILLQSIPSHIDVEGLTQKLLREFPDIQNVHDLHVWRLTASEVIATVHIILSSPELYASIKADLNRFFEKESISSVTIQPEFSKATYPDAKSECILQCSTNSGCNALTCCGPLTEKQKDKVRHRCHSSQTQKNCGTVTCRSFVFNKCENTPQKAFEVDLPLLPQYDFGRIASAVETNV